MELASREISPKLSLGCGGKPAVTKTAMNTGFIQFEARLRPFMREGPLGGFDDLALELFQLQFEHNLPYRRFCEAERRTPGRVKSWREAPAMPTAAFKDLELTSIPPGQRSAVFCSSGTTRQRPSRHFHNARSLALYETSVVEWGKRRLPLRNASVLFLTPPRALAPHSSLVHMFETLRHHGLGRRATFVGEADAEGAWEVNIARVISVLTVCASSGEPVGLLGTAFNFVHLLDAMRERQVRFPLAAGSWALETGGYKSRSRSLPKPELHRTISEILGLPLERIVCEYGMSELGSQAYDRPLIEASTGARCFQFPPWTRAQVVSPETGHEVSDGEIGLLRVWDLANVYSVMAIETDDLAMRRGSGFELVGRADKADSRGCSLMTV
jgi:hypothetical protein